MQRTDATIQKICHEVAVRARGYIFYFQLKMKHRFLPSSLQPGGRKLCVRNGSHKSPSAEATLTNWICRTSPVLRPQFPCQLGCAWYVGAVSITCISYASVVDNAPKTMKNKMKKINVKKSSQGLSIPEQEMRTLETIDKLMSHSACRQ